MDMLTIVTLQKTAETFLPSMQGGRSGPGGGRPAGSAALLSLPGPLPSELRPERRRSRPQAARGPALRRLRLLAARQRDLTAAAEGPQHGENGPIKRFITEWIRRLIYSLLGIEF